MIGRSMKHHKEVLSHSPHDVMLNMHEYPDISVLKLSASFYLNWLGHKRNYNLIISTRQSLHYAPPTVFAL